MAATMYSVPLSQLSPFLCTECLYAARVRRTEADSRARPLAKDN